MTDKTRPTIVPTSESKPPAADAGKDARRREEKPERATEGEAKRANEREAERAAEDASKQDDTIV